MNRHVNYTLISLAFLSLLAASSSAQMVILSDDFNDRTLGQNVECPTGTEDCFSDWGDNNNLLGGSIVQTYTTTPDRTSPGGVNQTIMDADDPANGENEGIVRFGAIQLDYDFASDADVIAGGGYNVAFDVRRGGGNFVALHFGADNNFVATTLQGAAFVVQQETTDVSILFQDDGGGGKRVKFGTFGDLDEVEGTAEVNDIGGLSDETFQVSVDVLAPSGFNAGDMVTYNVQVDGVDAFSKMVAVDGLFSSYVGFSTNSGGVTGGIYDDLVISSFEPQQMLPLLGDADNDNAVSGSDLLAVTNNFGMQGPADGFLIGDADDDGAVSGSDLLAVTNNFGATSANGSLLAANVPEPRAIMMLAVGMVGVALWRCSGRES